jgi:hypothetical protein
LCGGSDALVTVQRQASSTHGTLATPGRPAYTPIERHSSHTPSAPRGRKEAALARIIANNFGAIFYAPCRWAMVCTSVLPESPTSQAFIPRMLLTAGRQCITPTLNCGGTLASHLVVPCAVCY